MLDPDDWWGTMDADTLRCLGEHGPMTPAELGKRLVAHLAREGRVRICLVAAAE